MEWRIEQPKNGKTRAINLDLGVTPLWWKSYPDIANRMPGVGDIIVLKIPGSTYSNRGYTSYTGTYFQVLRIIRMDPQDNFVCEPIVDFPIRDK